MLQLLVSHRTRSTTVRFGWERWWADVRHEDGRIHWTVLPTSEWRVLPAPSARAFREHLESVAKDPHPLGSRAAVSLIQRYGPPTYVGDGWDGVSGLVSRKQTSVALADFAALVRYLAASVLLSHAVANRFLVTLSAWRSFVPAGLPKDVPNIGFTNKPTLASQGRMLTGLTRRFVELSGCETTINHDREHQGLALRLVPNEWAPLLGLFATTLLDTGTNMDGATPCPNHLRCGGVVVQRSEVGRPARFCEQCSPRGSTSSTERVRAYRARKKAQRLAE